MRLPMATAMPTVPSARPRSASGKSAVAMPELNAISMQAPTACRARRGDEPVKSRRQPATGGGHDEEQRAEKIEPAKAKQIAQTRHRQDQTRQQQQVDQRHPRHLGEGQVKVVLQHRQDHVHRAGIERRH